MSQLINDLLYFIKADLNWTEEEKEKIIDCHIQMTNIIMKCKENEKIKESLIIEEVMEKFDALVGSIQYGWKPQDSLRNYHEFL